MAVRIYTMDDSPIDIWTGVHAGVGGVAGYIGFPALLTLSLGLIFEGIENYKRPERTIPFFSTESAANIMLDLTTMMGAWFIGYAIRERRRGK